MRLGQCRASRSSIVKLPSGLFLLFPVVFPVVTVVVIIIVVIIASSSALVSSVLEMSSSPSSVVVRPPEAAVVPSTLAAGLVRAPVLLVPVIRGRS